jgi:hypothetical protein
MANLKTTISGLLVAVLGWAAQAFPKWHDVIMAAQNLALALLGYFAADSTKPKS